jgi:hypothetical protein
MLLKTEHFVKMFTGESEFRMFLFIRLLENKKEICYDHFHTYSPTHCKQNYTTKERAALTGVKFSYPSVLISLGPKLHRNCSLEHYLLSLQCINQVLKSLTVKYASQYLQKYMQRH